MMDDDLLKELRDAILFLVSVYDEEDITNKNLDYVRDVLAEMNHIFARQNTRNNPTYYSQELTEHLDDNPPSLA